MNKLYTLLISALLMACANTAPPTKSPAPIEPPTVEQTTQEQSKPLKPQEPEEDTAPPQVQDQTPNPNTTGAANAVQGPFAGHGWMLNVEGDTWYGKLLNYNEFVMLNRATDARAMVLTQPYEGTTNSLASAQLGPMHEAGITVGPITSLTVNGVRGLTFPSHKDPVEAWMTVFVQNKIGFMFACGGRKDSHLEKVCKDALMQLHIIQ